MAFWGQEDNEKVASEMWDWLGSDFMFIKKWHKGMKLEEEKFNTIQCG